MTTRTRKKIDPFATDTTDDAKENENMAETPTVDVTPEGSEITLTFKAGSGFEVPWIVIRTPDLASAEAILDNQSDLLKSVMEKTTRAGVFFASQMPSGAVKGGDGASAPTGGGSSRHTAPGGQSRTCKHGDMVYRSGSKNGNTWEGFFCPTPKGTADQCKAQFL